jgi:hypothetical protein
MSALMATRGQLRDMGMAFRRLGLDEREAIVACIWFIVQRGVESRKELTAREASAVLDGLEDWERARAIRRSA